MEYRQEPDVQNLLKDLIAMKARISKLLTQARQGLATVQNAKVEVARQAKEFEEQKDKILKLDLWLETINSGLKESAQQTEVTEEDILRYIEIYERYIREYEEYEMILKSITVISDDESSQSLAVKLVAMQKALEETRHLVVIEIERLRQVLLHMRLVPEVVEDDISQTDRTIDSTSMPEEVVSPREPEFIKEKVEEKVSSVREVSEKVQESEKVPTVQESKPSHDKPKAEEVKVPEVKSTVTIDTQTGKSLMSDPPSVVDKSVICKPEVIPTHDVSISCAPPQEIEVQTSEPHSEEKEIYENIQVRQTISDGHETIEIASRPVVREQKMDEQSLFIDANYNDDNVRKDSQLNITHSLPQSFETVMVEPDETTTEVVVDADGTKRIIVRKVRKTLVTRQQTLQTQQQSSHVLSREGHEHSYSQITLKEDKGSSATALEGGGMEHIRYQTYGGEVVSGLPGSEVTIQEFTSRPDMVIQMEKGIKPEEILQLAEGELPTQIQTSSSSVTAVVQQVTKRIIKTRRRIIRRVVIIDGKEHVTEEIVEEPDNYEVFEEQIPRVSINVREHGGVQFEEIDDPSDRGDQPPAIPPGTSEDVIPETDDKSSKNVQLPQGKSDTKDIPKDGSPKSHSDKSAQEQELQRLMEEFMKKESELGIRTNVSKTETFVRTSQEREITPLQTHPTKKETDALTSKVKKSSPIQTVTSESQDVISSKDETLITQEEPQDVKDQELRKRMKDFTEKVGKHGIQSNVTKKETAIRTSQEKESTPMQTKRETVVRNSQEKEISPIETVTFSESHEVLPSGDPTQTIQEYTIQDPHNAHDQELQRLMKEFINKEGEHSTQTNITKTETVVRKPQDKEGTPIQTVMISESEEVLPSDNAAQTDREYFVQEPLEGHTLFTSHGVHQSTFETTSSNMSTIVQKVTRKITRTRKRIIKHIQIIDGKEHVTEEVIEEPDDVEIIEEVPKVTHNVQTEGIRTKRIKIIKQIQIIDGKEQVTEQIVEEPDDEYVPDSTVTAEIDVQISKRDVPSYHHQENVNDIPLQRTVEQTMFAPVRKDTSTLDITKNLIGSEIDHSTVSLTPTEKLHDKTPYKENKIKDVKQPVSIKDTKPNERVSEERGVIHIVRKAVIDEPDETFTSTIIKDKVEPIAAKTITPSKINESTDIKKSPSPVPEKIKEQATAPKEATVTIEKVVKPDSGTIFTTTTQTKATKSVTADPVTVKETITTEVTTIPQNEVPIEQSSEIVTPEKVLQLIQETVQTTEPQLTVTTISTKEEAPTVIEFVGYEPAQIKDSNVIEVSKTLIESEVGHALTSQILKDSIDDKKEKPKDKPKNERKHNTSSKENGIAEIRKKQEVVSKTTAETTAPQVSDVAVTKESTTINAPLQGASSIKETLVTEMTTVFPITEKDTSLIDMTKGLIGSEISHSGTSQTPAQFGIKKDMHASKEVETPQKAEMLSDNLVKDAMVPTTTVAETKLVIKPAEDNLTITTSKTTVTTPETDTAEQLKHDDKPTSLEKAVEKVTHKPKIKTMTMTTELASNIISTKDKNKLSDKKETPCTEIKDTKLMDITKSFIGSEMDHTVISKIPASPVKVTESGKLDLFKKDDLSSTEKISEAEALTTITVSKEIVTNLGESKPVAISQQKPEDIEEPIVIDKIVEMEPTKVEDEKEKETIHTGYVNIPTQPSLDDKSGDDKSDLSDSKIQKSHEKTVSAKTGDSNAQIIKLENETKTLDITRITPKDPIYLPDEPKSKEPLKVTEDATPIIHDFDTKNKSLSVPKQPEQLQSLEENAPAELMESEINLLTEKEVIDKNKISDQPLLQKTESYHIDRVFQKTITLEENPELSVLELTKELLERESIHTGEIQFHVKHSLDKTVDEKPDLRESKIQAFEDKPVPATTGDTNVETLKLKHETKTSEITTVTDEELKDPGSLSDEFKHKQPLKKPQDAKPITRTISKQPEKIEVPEVNIMEQIAEPAITSVTGKEVVGTTQISDDNLLKTTAEIKPQKTAVELTEELILQEASLDQVRTRTTEKVVSHIKTENAPAQSSIEVEQLKVGTVLSESDMTNAPKSPELSYVRQFEPKVQGSSDSVNKLLATFGQPEQKEMPTQTSPPFEFTGSGTGKSKPDTKYDVTMLLEAERKDTHLGGFKPTPPSDTIVVSDKPQQTIDISMSLTKTDVVKMTEPKVKVDLKVEGFESKQPSIVKKDIDVNLPSQVTVIRKDIKAPVVDVAQKDQSMIELSLEDSVKGNKKSKKRKKYKRSSESSESIPIETQPDTPDKSIADTDSSSLSHYVELPTSPPVESPKPTEDVLEPTVDIQEVEQDSSIVESEPITEERGYEPEDISLALIATPDKKKRQRRRKQHGVSEDTTYPKLSTTESDDTSSSMPVEVVEPLFVKKDKKDKKWKKKTPDEQKTAPEQEPQLTPETKPESPKMGSEVVVTSPKDESYRTISETSDIDTVKIVEECVQSSPETVKSEVQTTVIFTVPVVEEISVQEGSIQTSPEPVQRVEEVSRPETLDTELQTSPTPVSEATIQTTPVEEKEAHSQTVEEVTIIEKVERSDTEMQTSRTETPEKIEQFEVTTQVVPHDISTPEEKFSQTTPPVEEPVAVKEEEPEKSQIVSEAKEIQTSPLPEVRKDEKSTETVVETTETDIQTVQKEQVNQETSTTPVKEKQVSEMSIQTPEVPLVSTFTQSDEPEPTVETEETVDKEEIPLHDLEKKEVITTDSTQQTTPRVDLEEVFIPKLDLTKVGIATVDSTQQTTPRDPEVVPALEILQPVLEVQQPRKEIRTADNTQQTTPREPEVISVLEIHQPKTEIITADNIQQTSPRTPSREPTPVPTLDFEKRENIKMDSTQQTSPRVYSEDSISTSTDEPYEVHLRARITIPESTNDFLENERQFQEHPHSIVGERQKQKKRKSKKKGESPLVQSPESLSDPINSELSDSVTPTSEDLSSRDPSSMDEGISQYASPQLPRHQVISQPKLTYSDVVQRSKSKSPSPIKTLIPEKSEKARLLDALEKRTQSVTEPQKNIPDDSMTVALIEPSVEKSYDLVIHKELNEVKNAVEVNDPTRTERSVIVVIETISIWLEEIQYKIQRQTVSGTTITTAESERLKSLQSYVKNLKEIIEVVEINEEIITLIETLTRQVDAVNTLSKQSPLKVKEVEKEWEKFQEDTDKLVRSVDRVKSNLDNVIMSELPTQQKLDNLDKIEFDNVDNFDTITKMFKRYRVLLEINPKRECPSKLYICEDDTKQIENAVNTERDRLLQLTSLAEEYEQTLQDFGQITDVAEALLDSKIIVSDLDHLHEEIQKHRTFFVNLSHCRAILESLEDNLDSETKSKYAPLHNSLHDRATLIIDRAASRAQQMTLAASRWKLLEQGMKEEQQWLIVAQQRIPDLTNVTSRDHEQYINLYQSISLDVSHHYAKLLRLLSITESLQQLILCSGLDNECSTALDMLLKLQEDVDSRLTRLTAFKENWVTYDHLIDRIEGWMKIANRELEFITPENITATGNLRRFWELKAQHEVYNNLKNESGVQFERALEILPISDEMVQRQFFSKVENKWCDLANRIGDIHGSVIQNISDRDVSSGEKLNILEEEMRELRAALDGLKGVVRSEDELNLYIERLQVMTGRIDRIQNELGRLSLLPTAESERVGALLTQSGILDDQISEELERSLLLKEKIVQVQTGIIRCQKSQRKARLTLEECEAAERLGSDVVERASETCEKLIEDLSSQWRDILGLRQALHTLPTSLRVIVSPTGVERDISALQETHGDLETACGHLSARLRAKLQLWRRFERQMELVQGAVREADYMVELLTVQGQVDYDRLLKATEKLETLSESLSRRSGELVGELQSAAAPLEAASDPAVAAALRRDRDAAAAAYSHTCTTLTQLCDKYHKAVEVWKRYRDAAAAVRAFTEFQEGRLHALRPDDAPLTAQACLEQEARVAELRSLAARVAAETGSRALQADADALARRLQLVAGAVQALADLGEARQVARAKAHHAKEMFCDMRQDLTPVHEDGEIVEDKLIALRDNLIALGKSEADIAPAKAELPDIDRDVSDEHSIVRILELWQAMFRDTFLHYHRLSTALVRSGDAATALRLWHEYLIDLQSFLSGSVPADYENLTEHRRLCRVHRNLLTSQRSVLMNENRDTRNKELADKFDTLTNLHNETLARIVERHDEVCSRIASWDDYREVYTELLRWLKEMEREKEKLQLRYVHIKRVQKILVKIQNLADKVPEGKKQTDNLLVNLKKVLVFTEEAYGAQVRMESAGVVKRVENLQASLDTWRDFLTRILGLIGEYDKLTGDLHKLYSRTQDEIMNYSDEDRLSRPQLKKTIDRYVDLRTKIEKTETQIEALSVIQEQLKECLSPQDIRIVNQRVWQLRQQRADLEHQLSIIIHRLQERFEVYTIFDSRLSRFAEWITTIENRLETSSQTEIALDPQDLIRRITSDVQSETAMKEREFEWISETGNSLVEISKKDEKSYSKNTSKQLKDVLGRWHKLQETGRSRIAKIHELLLTITNLEERLTEIRIKLHTIESKLSTSIVLEHLTTKAVDEKFRERDEIHRSIESESGDVGKTLNLCELVFNDPDVAKGNFDLRNLRTGSDIVDKKWKNICDMSEHRKNSLKEIRKSAELATSLLPKVEKKLDGIEKRVEKIETRKQRGDAEDESVSKSVIKDLEALEGDVKKLEDAYSRIASARGIELRGSGADDAARLRGAIRRWQLLRGRVDAAGADAHRQFVAAHGRAVVALAETDVRLTRALHLAPTPLDKEATLKELDGVELELLECQTLVEDADRLSVSVITVAGVSTMMAEYRALFADVRTRLDLARAEVVGDVDSAVQVDTLKWVTDASLQVDTLTSKETYRSELVIAVKETSESLEALRNALLQQPKDDANSEELANAAKEIAKAGAKPAQTLELAKHLSELLLTECDANEDEAMMKEVEHLSMRYEDLLAQAKKRELQINNLRLPHSASYALTCEHDSGRLTCPLCSERNWKQLDNDLWRLEQWLQFAEATDAARTDPPEQYDLLEDAIQDHREFLLDLDSHKSIVVSLNVVGSHVAAHARRSADGERVRARLARDNERWDAACAAAARWQRRLQAALMHNHQFHDIVVELVAQLAAAERSVRGREPLRLSRDAAELQRDFRRFSELRDELRRAEPRVLALHDAAQLLRDGDPPASAHDICRRLGELRLRLQSLRKLSGVYALKLGAALARAPGRGSALAAVAAAAAPQLNEEDEEQLSASNLPPLDENDAVASEESDEQQMSRLQRGLRFVSRVARASLPFQALLLLLLGAAALAPQAPGACRAPGLALEPVLRYPEGPPPL